MQANLTADRSDIQNFVVTYTVLNRHEMIIEIRGQWQGHISDSVAKRVD